MQEANERKCDPRIESDVVAMETALYKYRNETFNKGDKILANRLLNRLSLCSDLSLVIGKEGGITREEFDVIFLKVKTEIMTELETRGISFKKPEMQRKKGGETR